MTSYSPDGWVLPEYTLLQIVFQSEMSSNGVFAFDGIRDDVEHVSIQGKVFTNEYENLHAIMWIDPHALLQLKEAKTLKCVTQNVPLSPEAFWYIESDDPPLPVPSPPAFKRHFSVKEFLDDQLPLRGQFESPMCAGVMGKQVAAVYKTRESPGHFLLATRIRFKPFQELESVGCSERERYSRNTIDAHDCRVTKGKICFLLEKLPHHVLWSNSPSHIT